MPCYIIMQTLKHQRNLLTMGSIACTVCKLDLDMLMLPRTFHIRELSSHCTTLPTFSHHNQKPRDKMTSQRQVAFVYRPLPQPSLPLREIQQARVLSDENCGNPGLQWLDTMGTVDGINKERTRRTCGGEIIMWAALFLPTGFWHIIRDGVRENRKGRTVHYLTSPSHSSYPTNCWRAHSTTSIPHISARRSPTLTRRNAHLGDLVIPTRQRRKKFSKWVTGP